MSGVDAYTESTTNNCMHNCLNVSPPKHLPPAPVLPSLSSPGSPLPPCRLMLPVYPLRLALVFSNHTHKELTATEFLRQLHPRPCIRVLTPQPPNLSNIILVEMVGLLVWLSNRRRQGGRRARWKETVCVEWCAGRCDVGGLPCVRQFCCVLLSGSV